MKREMKYIYFRRKVCLSKWSQWSQAPNPPSEAASIPTALEGSKSGDPQGLGDAPTGSSR